MRDMTNATARKPYAQPKLEELESAVSMTGVFKVGPLSS